MLKIFEHLYEQKEQKRVLVMQDSGVQDFVHDPAKMRKHLEGLKKEMLQAAADLEFEDAARLRDEIKALEEAELGV